jgi:hypothetical protein
MNPRGSSFEKPQRPIGYDVRDRRLVINPAEAETVRQIFGRYLVEVCSKEVSQVSLEILIVAVAREAQLWDCRKDPEC